jgi:hypothetical protein
MHNFIYLIGKPQSLHLMPLKYFYKSRLLYKYSCYIFIAVIALTQIPKFSSIFSVVQSLLIGISVLILYIITPLGIFYSIKSFVKNEPPNKYRMYYLAGHTIFLLVLLALLVSIYWDVLKFSR